jgi:hypothetical protein
MKTKKQLQDEIEQLRGIALALYKALEKTPETDASKESINDFIKYIMEKV